MKCAVYFFIYEPTKRRRVRHLAMARIFATTRWTAAGGEEGDGGGEGAAAAAAVTVAAVAEGHCEFWNCSARFSAASVKSILTIMFFFYLCPASFGHTLSTYEYEMHLHGQPTKEKTQQ